MERIRINNFAGLKEVNLEVSQVTGFIGPQASGKSIIAKLLYFFRGTASWLPDAAFRLMSSDEYKAECLRRFNLYFSMDATSGTPGFHISYTSESGRVSVEFSRGRGRPGSRRLEWSAFYPSAFESLAEKWRERRGALGEANPGAIDDAQQRLLQEYDEEAKKALGPWSIYAQIFIPAGRAFFSQFEAGSFTALESSADRDPFMGAFRRELGQTTLRLQQDGFFDAPSPAAGRFGAFRPLMMGILHAKLGFDEEQKKYFLDYADGRRVWMAQVSSGEQEAWPLLLVLARSFSSPHGRGRALYIEEPEAHLFPPAQKQIVELLGRVFRVNADEMSLVITTHSPYILTSINNLLQAGKLYRRCPETEGGSAMASRLSNIVPSSFAPGEVSFYALEGGSAESIMDPETGLIDAAVIDQVSADIAIEFDKLLSMADEKP